MKTSALANQIIREQLCFVYISSDVFSLVFSVPFAG